MARALVLTRGPVIDRDDILLLPEGGINTTGHWADLAPLQNGWKEDIERLERALVERSLAVAQGNKSKAAENSGDSPPIALRKTATAWHGEFRARRMMICTYSLSAFWSFPAILPPQGKAGVRPFSGADALRGTLTTARSC